MAPVGRLGEYRHPVPIDRACDVSSNNLKIGLLDARLGFLGDIFTSGHPVGSMPPLSSRANIASRRPEQPSSTSAPAAAAECMPLAHPDGTGTPGRRRACPTCGAAPAEESLWAVDGNHHEAAPLIDSGRSATRPAIELRAWQVTGASASYGGGAGHTETVDAPIIADEARMRRDPVVLPPVDERTVALQMLTPRRTDSPTTTPAGSTGVSAPRQHPRSPPTPLDERASSTPIAARPWSVLARSADTSRQLPFHRPLVDPARSYGGTIGISRRHRRARQTSTPRDRRWPARRPHGGRGRARITRSRAAPSPAVSWARARSRRAVPVRGALSQNVYTVGRHARRQLDRPEAMGIPARATRPWGPAGQHIRPDTDCAVPCRAADAGGTRAARRTARHEEARAALRGNSRHDQRTQGCPRGRTRRSS